MFLGSPMIMETIGPPLLANQHNYRISPFFIGKTTVKLLQMVDAWWFFPGGSRLVWPGLDLDQASAAPGTRHQLVAEYDLWQLGLRNIGMAGPAEPDRNFCGF